MQVSVSKIESQMERIAGCPVELVIRGDKDFTFAAEGMRSRELGKIAKFFGNAAVSKFEFDEEIDYSVLFVTVK